MKMRYGRLIFLIITICLITSVSASAADQIGNITYAPEPIIDPSVGLITDTKMPVLKAGESGVLEIPVKTSSPYTAFDVVAHITQSDTTLPFEFENLSPYSKPIQVFYNIPAKIAYDVYVPADTASGVYPINIDLSYSDMMGNTYNRNLVFYIRVENSAFNNSNLNHLIVNSCIVPEITQKGDGFTAEIELKNISGMQLNKVSVEIIPPSGINIANDTAIKGGAFYKDDIKKFKFNLLSSKNADGGTYPISFKISVYGKDSTTVIEEFSFNSVVIIPEGNYDYNPSLEIVDIRLPESVKPGESFTIYSTYKNTGDCELRYIKTELIADISANTFVNKSATSHLVQTLLPGESVTKEYNLIVSEKAKGDFYDLKFNANAKYDVWDNEEGDITTNYYSGFYVERDTEISAPYSISDIEIDEKISQNGDFTLKFNVNINTYAEGLKIEALLPEGIINTSPCVFWYDAVNEGSVITNEIKLVCSDNITDGYNSIKLSVSAKDVTEIFQYTGFYTEGSSSKAYYSISDISLPSEIDVADGKEFDFSFTVTCLNADDEDVTIDVNLPAGIINRSLSKFNVGNMKKGDSVTKTVKLYATKDAPDGFANIEISVNSKSVDKLGQFTGIDIKNTTAQKDDIPVVIIDEYDYGSEYVLGGATFPLRLKFLNTSLNGGVKDLKITLASDENGVFTPAASSNTYFIQTLSPGESSEWELDIQTKSDIQPQSYGFIINISYKNENGVEKTDVETLTIPVRQEMRFNISELPVFNDISMNEDAILALNCANLGKSTVYNVLIKIQGNFSSTEYEIFAGNIEAGKGYSNTVYLTPMMEGLQEGTVTFQYEDADGVVTTEEKTISFNAYNMNSDMGVMYPFEPDEMPIEEDPGEQEGGMSGWLWFVIIGAVVIVVASAVVIFVKLRKRKKSKASEEDDDEY